MAKKLRLLKRVPSKLPFNDSTIWISDIEKVLRKLPRQELWDLVVTSPPYNIGKEYEKKIGLDDYIRWQTNIIMELTQRVKASGSICWQVGNFVENGCIAPLDYVFHPIFESLGLKLRNRIVWRFGHGKHNKRRFSGRYEIVLWYTKSDDYVFNLDEVRIPQKYPGKRAYKGPNIGKLSSNPLGKNPEDVWEVPEAEIDVWNIPNVKANHLEKTAHPCQFPVALIERLLLALTNENALVFDPFAGSGSAGVAAAIHGRRFWGCEIDPTYAAISKERIDLALAGKAKFRSHERPLYNHLLSPLSALID